MIPGPRVLTATLLIGSLMLAAPAQLWAQEGTGATAPAAQTLPAAQEQTEAPAPPGNEQTGSEAPAQPSSDRPTPADAGALEAEGPAEGQEGQEGQYRDAIFVQVFLGRVNREEGLRLLSYFEDGANAPITVNQAEARRATACAGQPLGTCESFLYFDVADSYLYGGINEVDVTLTFLDQGFGPVYLDYDAVDPERPNSTSATQPYKRRQVAVRGNTGVWRTVRVNLADARLAGGLDGADLRVGGPGSLVLRGAAVFKLASFQPPPPIRVVIDGREVEFADAAPFVQEGRLLVPLRPIFEALGITITWDGETQTVYASRNGFSLRLTVGAEWAYANYLPYRLDVPAQIFDGRTYVPFRFVGDALGYQVGWDEETQTASFTNRAPAPAGPPLSGGLGGNPGQPPGADEQPDTGAQPPVPGEEPGGEGRRPDDQPPAHGEEPETEAPRGDDATP